MAGYAWLDDLHRRLIVIWVTNHLLSKADVGRRISTIDLSGLTGLQVVLFAWLLSAAVCSSVIIGDE